MPVRDLPWVAPDRAAARLARDAPDCRFVLFDSAGPLGDGARFSYLALDPVRVIADADADAAPLDALDQALAAGHHAALPPDQAGFAFRGGVAGFIGYECAAAWQGVPARHAPHPDDPPGLWFGLFDLVIGFDRAERRTRVQATPLGGNSARALARLDWACGWLRRAADDDAPADRLPTLRFAPDLTEAAYRDRVADILAYIRAGDIFQANLTMAHVAARPPGLDMAEVHARLRARNPAPFGGWLRAERFDLISASPERFIALDHAGRIETRPIKGTAPRDADAAADRARAAWLETSEKDRAENIMIVDVLRNDIGRVARLGSVRVPDLCRLTSFATVHHLVSRIEGALAPGRGPVDVLRAALPGGSITGAPKIRAMQIIAELEAARRGPYCGSMAWIGFDGAMDSNIIIRGLLATPRRLIAQAGGGIVADSDPAAEYAEMRLKLAPVLAVFGGGS